MAVVENTLSKTVAFRLISGQTSAGVNKYLNVNLSGVNPDAELNNANLYALGQAFAPLFSMPSAGISKVVRSEIVNAQ